MVRAILDGRKTETRRIVKPQPVGWVPRQILCEWYEPIVVRRGIQEPGDPVFGFASEDEGWKCPYGAPGDRLWVRESFCQLEPEHWIGDQRFAYKANCDADGERCRRDYVNAGYPYKWKPSIHMPRRACRITLEVTGVCVERLQCITNESARAEGFEPTERASESDAFHNLWDEINGPDSWHENPWVWVVKFKLIDPVIG